MSRTWEHLRFFFPPLCKFNKKMTILSSNFQGEWNAALAHSVNGKMACHCAEMPANKELVSYNITFSHASQDQADLFILSVNTHTTNKYVSCLPLNLKTRSNMTSWTNPITQHVVPSADCFQLQWTSPELSGTKINVFKKTSDFQGLKTAFALQKGENHFSLYHYRQIWLISITAHCNGCVPCNMFFFS